MPMDKRSTMMVAEVVNPLSSKAFPRLWEAASPFLILIGSLFVYAAVRSLVLRIADGPPVGCLALEITTLVIAALALKVKYSHIPPLLRVLVRGIGVVLLIQIAFDAATVFFGPVGELPPPYSAFFRVGSAIGLAAGVLALRYPSFIIPTAIHYIAFRHQFNAASGIAVSETDYGSLLDIGLFVTIGALTTIISTRQDWMTRHMENPMGANILEKASSLIWACAVGAHLGNYLVSGWTKVRVGGADPFFWLLHNPTQTSILIGLERGDNPLAAWPWLV
ncbi:MAG: hypothetical protein EPO08_14990, partial [Rhodospirillaceae bacterium]